MSNSFEVASNDRCTAGRSANQKCGGQVAAALEAVLLPCQIWEHKDIPKQIIELCLLLSSDCTTGSEQKYYI